MRLIIFFTLVGLLSPFFGEESKNQSSNETVLLEDSSEEDESESEEVFLKVKEFLEKNHLNAFEAIVKESSFGRMFHFGNHGQIKAQFRTFLGLQFLNSENKKIFALLPFETIGEIFLPFLRAENYTEFSKRYELVLDEENYELHLKNATPEYKVSLKIEDNGSISKIYLHFLDPKKKRLDSEIELSYEIKEEKAQITKVKIKNANRRRENYLVLDEYRYL